MDVDVAQGGPTVGPDSQVRDFLDRRDELTGRLESSLARKLKRALQDEQNSLLDRLRSLKGPVTAADVLPSIEEQPDRFVDAGRPVLEQAVQAGSELVASFYGEAAGAHVGLEGIDDLAEELGKAITEPLRQRLELAFRSSNEDPADVAEALAASYREWKTHRIEAAARDQVAAAFARGVLPGLSRRVRAPLGSQPVGRHRARTVRTTLWPESRPRATTGPRVSSILPLTLAAAVLSPWFRPTSPSHKCGFQCLQRYFGDLMARRRRAHSEGPLPPSGCAPIGSGMPMRASSDIPAPLFSSQSPYSLGPRHRCRRLDMVVAVAPHVASFYTDFLWFRSVGFSSVSIKTITIQIGLRRAPSPLSSSVFSGGTSYWLTVWRPLSPPLRPPTSSLPARRTGCRSHALDPPRRVRWLRLDRRGSRAQPMGQLVAIFQCPSRSRHPRPVNALTR